MSFRVISDAQNEQERDEIDEERDDLAKKMGDGRAPLFFPIGIPEIAVKKRDEERGAEKKENGADMIPPITSPTPGINPTAASTPTRRRVPGMAIASSIRNAKRRSATRSDGNFSSGSMTSGM